ncbi:MAG: hypothetical protein A2712_00450 [Deltaproteobacteria bacterium RIFCSPHIGHO2_01_FULL_43_49]|nr:MAG: hypothetical protein A2712_00450 [Deltaproteobacteria bacterium RIFCSPHIGHO2_01_FULL_43_49]OGQ14255.1 MAG: hypothetical protein A3D22_10165 [Deltaproteobacteria bacterium RIFCSPHIGHO2_02_FULL_44_53]OGQ42396.1 MAG: hypothetical protein A3I70_02675 [Deltaproteobacteria bacterium RIFCSPLOWO2_02_FULL_44_34]
MKLRTLNLELRTLLIMLLLMCSKGYAGDTGLMGFDRQLFKPAADQSGIYNVVGTEIPPNLKVRAGFATNLGSDSNTVVVPATGRQVEVLDFFWGGDFLVASSYWDHFSFGLGLPVLFVQSGTNFNTLQSFTASSLGDLRLDLKYRLAKESKKFPALALFSRFSFPTGSQAKFTGERGVSWDYRLVGDKAFDVLGSTFYVLGNVGFKLRKTVRILSSEFGDAFTFGVGARYQLPWQQKSWAVETELVGEKLFTDTKQSTVPLEWRLGVRKTVLGSKSKVHSSRDLEPRTSNLERCSYYFGVGKGLTSAIGSPAFRVFGGFTWQF